jgi:hypothetical protein
LLIFKKSLLTLDKNREGGKGGDKKNKSNFYYCIEGTMLKSLLF